MKLTDFKNTLQQMLDKEMRIAGELNEIEMQLEIKQTNYLQSREEEGNLLYRVSLKNVCSDSGIIKASAKDKRFSLSSVFSGPSLELNNIEDKRLSVPNQARFNKSKLKQNSKDRKVLKPKHNRKKITRKNHDATPRQRNRPQFRRTYRQ